MMKKAILILCCLLLTLSAAAKDTKEYKGQKFTFQYPSFLKLTTNEESDSLCAISFSDGNGTEVDVNLIIPGKDYTAEDYSRFFNQLTVSYLFQRVGFGNFSMKKIESDSLTTVTIGSAPATGFSFEALFTGQPLYGNILSAKLDSHHFVTLSTCTKDSTLLDQLKIVASTLNFVNSSMPEKHIIPLPEGGGARGEASTTPSPDVFDVVEEMPSFPGGNSELMKFLSTNTVYPDSAYNNGIQGRVVVNFVVEKDGSIGEVKVVRSVSPELDNEAMRVVQSMPAWTPGKLNGQTVRVRYNVPISFKLPEVTKQPDLRIISLANSISGNFETSALGQIDPDPKTPASFIGGEESLNEYVASNLYYPPHLRDFGIEDSMTVEFIVEKTGQLSNIQIVNYHSETLAKNALAMVQAMPAWNPALDKKKQPVRSRNSFNVEFKK